MPLRLSPKFGVNPSISTCFWCGDAKNEIVLFGAGYKHGQEAPHHIIMNYEPCEKCQNGMASGVTLIEASNQPLKAGQGEMQKGVYPTGRWWVITAEAAARIFNHPKLVDKAFIEVGVAEKIGLPAPV